MQPNIITRTKYVGDKIVCRYCYENCVKHGRFSPKKRSEVGLQKNFHKIF